MERMRQHAERFHTRDRGRPDPHRATLRQRPFRLHGRRRQLHLRRADHRHRRGRQYLGLPSEDAFKGKGVSACATCDGFFFRKQKVAVIGGGNTAVEEALYLSNIADHVTLVHRRDRLRARRSCRTGCWRGGRARSSIVWNHEVDEILGDDSGVTGLRLRAGDRRRHAGRWRCTGVFVAIGHTPNTGIFEDQLAMKDGYLPVQQRQRTATPPRPACPACSPPATSPTRSTARRSPRPAPAAWRRWMPTSTWNGLDAGADRPGDRGRQRKRHASHCANSRRSTPSRADWNALAATACPFLRHEFLAALESTGCVGGAPAGRPHTWRSGRAASLVAATPLYRKSHSWGEFVFDFGWAQAYERHGLRYYPKLLWQCRSRPSPARGCCSPRTSRRACASAGRRRCDERARASASPRRTRCSSTPRTRGFGARGWLLRQRRAVPLAQSRLRATSTSSSTRFTRGEAQEDPARAPSVRGSRHQLRAPCGRQLTPRLLRFVHHVHARTFLRHGHEPYLNLAFFRAWRSAWAMR